MCGRMISAASLTTDIYIYISVVNAVVNAVVIYIYNIYIYEVGATADNPGTTLFLNRKM